MTTSNFVIYGAGGHAKVLEDLLEKLDLNVEVFFDDSGKIDSVNGVRVTSYDASVSPQLPLVIGIGNPKIRKLLLEKIKHIFSSLIHPTAVVASDVEIGEGTVVLAGAVIQSGAKIGRHVIINSNVTIDHDAVISDFVTTYPGAYVGAEAIVGEGVVVNPNSVIMRFCEVPAYYDIAPGEIIDGKI